MVTGHTSSPKPLILTRHMAASIPYYCCAAWVTRQPANTSRHPTSLPAMVSAASLLMRSVALPVMLSAALPVVLSARGLRVQAWQQARVVPYHLKRSRVYGRGCLQRDRLGPETASERGRAWLGGGLVKGCDRSLAG